MSDESDDNMAGSRGRSKKRCRTAKGKFKKCSSGGSSSRAGSRSKKGSKKGGAKRSSKKRCRTSKGRFKKC